MPASNWQKASAKTRQHYLPKLVVVWPERRPRRSKPRAGSMTWEDVLVRCALGCYLAAGVFIGLAIVTSPNMQLGWLPGFGIFALSIATTFGLKRHARL